MSPKEKGSRKSSKRKIHISNINNVNINIVGGDVIKSSDFDKGKINPRMPGDSTTDAPLPEDKNNKHKKGK